jgi:hypothetical protein
MASTSTLTACTFPLIETLQALSWLLQSLSRSLQSVLRPLETLSRPLHSHGLFKHSQASKSFFFGPPMDATSSLTAFIRTLMVYSSSLPQNDRYCICAKVSLSHFLFCQNFGPFHYFSNFFEVFFIFFKKIRYKYFSFVYKCSQVYYSISSFIYFM